MPSHGSTRTATTRELSLKYAQHLDKTLPERHKGVLKSMVRKVAEEHSRHVRMGQAAEEQYNERGHESAADVKALNRDAWLKQMFPDAAWPAPWRQNNFASVNGGMNDPLVGTRGWIPLHSLTHFLVQNT